jgi:hypothetical protein
MSAPAAEVDIAARRWRVRLTPPTVISGQQLAEAGLAAAKNAGRLQSWTLLDELMSKRP